MPFNSEIAMASTFLLKNLRIYVSHEKNINLAPFGSEIAILSPIWCFSIPK